MKLKHILNIHKDDVEGYKIWGTYKEFIVGKPIDSGCYHSIQLENFGIVGLYIEVEDEEKTEGDMQIC